MAGSIGISISSAPTLRDDRPGVGLRLVAGVGGGHDDAAHPLRAERVGGDQRRPAPSRYRPRPPPGRARSRSCARSRAGRASAPRRPRPPARAARRAGGSTLAARARAPRSGRATGAVAPAGAPSARVTALGGPVADARRARGRRAGAPRRTGPRAPGSRPARRRPRCGRRRPARPGRPTRLHIANAAPVSRARSWRPSRSRTVPLPRW